MRRRGLFMAVALTAVGMPAASFAQTPGAVQAACSKYLLPAMAEPSRRSPNGSTIDCGCVTGYLVGRFGDADAEIIVRLFASASGGPDALRAVGNELGADRIRTVLGKVGKFQQLGRELNQTCPEAKKP